MKIALPIENGLLCAHFGHALQFALISVDPEKKEILNVETMTPPAHEPGVLPHWLRENDASVIITGGMGRRAQDMFDEFGIHVVVGANPDAPESVAKAYLDGTLEAGSNVCDH